MNYEYIAANIDDVIETVCKDNKPLLVKDDMYGDFVIPIVVISLLFNFLIPSLIWSLIL